MTELTYTFSLYSRNIRLHFVVEEEIDRVVVETYDKYVDAIIMWLYMLNKHASKTCSRKLSVYFYFTSLEKHLPSSNIFVLDEINVNTAFTTTCPLDSEIVVFRKEEWFKVFIHETFHNFGLDFSDMNNDYIHTCIAEIFKVNSDINVFEAYTEFWAEIMNALFCSFFSLKTNYSTKKSDKSDKFDDKSDEFLDRAEFFINFERLYSFFQLVKALDFMGLTYSDLYSNSTHSKIIRETLYNEKTSVLSYYVIKAILMNNYQGFLSWCKITNFSLFQFSKTVLAQKSFCNFIKKNYKTKTMLEGVNASLSFLNRIKKGIKKNKTSKNYVLSNLRMSICELG